MVFSSGYKYFDAFQVESSKTPPPVYRRRFAQVLPIYSYHGLNTCIHTHVCSFVCVCFDLIHYSAFSAAKAM